MEYFRSISHCWRREPITIEDLSMSAHGCQVLPLATSHIVYDNREFEVSGTFRGVLLIVGRMELINFEVLSSSAHSY